MIKVTNMYKSHNTNYIKIIGLVLLNILYVIINLTRVKRWLSTRETLVILSGFGGYLVTA